jgi:hypothetical protein
MKNNNTSGATAVYGYVYRNGVAVGAEKNTVAPHTIATIFSQDLSGWASGDLLQVYGKASGNGSDICEISNLQIHGAAPGDFGSNTSY